MEFKLDMRGVAGQRDDVHARDAEDASQLCLDRVPLRKAVDRNQDGKMFGRALEVLARLTPVFLDLAAHLTHAVGQNGGIGLGVCGSLVPYRRQREMDGIAAFARAVIARDVDAKRLLRIRRVLRQVERGHDGAARLIFFHERLKRLRFSGKRVRRADNRNIVEIARRNHKRHKARLLLRVVPCGVPRRAFFPQDRAAVLVDEGQDHQRTASDFREGAAAFAEIGARRGRFELNRHRANIAKGRNMFVLNLEGLNEARQRIVVRLWGLAFDPEARSQLIERRALGLQNGLIPRMGRRIRRHVHADIRYPVGRGIVVILGASRQKTAGHKKKSQKKG